MAAHKGVMMIVLNHIDEVPEDRRPSMMADLRRLLDADGLQGVTLVATSAKEGIGIDDLRTGIVARVKDKATTRARIATDVAEAAAEIAAVSGQARVPRIADRDHAELRAAIADAAGVPIVVDAVHKAAMIRARRATGWPVTAWLSKLRPDPLKRLHLDLGTSGRDLVASARSSIPDANQIQRARIESAVRDLSDKVSGGLSRPWASALRRASTSGLPDLEDRLDRAVGGVDLGVGRIPLWTRAVRALQWLLLLSAVVGGLWLGALAVMSYLQVSEPTTPDAGPVPVPTLMLVGGVAVGLVLAVLCRVLVGRSARARARRADRRLREAVDEVADELVIAPLQAEIDAYRVTTDGLQVAAG
jgi:hypothetical protein